MYLQVGRTCKLTSACLSVCGDKAKGGRISLICNYR